MLTIPRVEIAAVEAALAAVDCRRHPPARRRHAVGDRQLAAAGALRPGLTVPPALGLLSVLCFVEAFADFTTRFGWTPHNARPGRLKPCASCCSAPSHRPDSPDAEVHRGLRRVTRRYA
jgi:hypothetical protein